MIQHAHVDLWHDEREALGLTESNGDMGCCIAIDIRCTQVASIDQVPCTFDVAIPAGNHQSRPPILILSSCIHMLEQSLNHFWLVGSGGYHQDIHASLVRDLHVGVGLQNVEAFRVPVSDAVDKSCATMFVLPVALALIEAWGVHDVFDHLIVPVPCRMHQLSHVVLQRMSLALKSHQGSGSLQAAIRDGDSNVGVGFGVAEI